MIELYRFDERVIDAAMAGCVNYPNQNKQMIGGCGCGVICSEASSYQGERI